MGPVWLELSCMNFSYMLSQFDAAMTLANLGPGSAPLVDLEILHTTQRYVHATGADLRDAIGRLPGN